MLSEEKIKYCINNSINFSAHKDIFGISDFKERLKDLSRIIGIPEEMLLDKLFDDIKKDNDFKELLESREPGVIRRLLVRIAEINSTKKETKDAK